MKWDCWIFLAEIDHFMTKNTDLKNQKDGHR